MERCHGDIAKDPTIAYHVRLNLICFTLLYILTTIFVSVLVDFKLPKGEPGQFYKNSLSG